MKHLKYFRLTRNAWQGCFLQKMTDEAFIFINSVPRLSEVFLLWKNCRGVFRTLSVIYDGVSLGKKVKAKINPFFSNAPFVYPMKTSENRKVSFLTVTQTGNYTFKVNNRNTRASFKICSRLTIKTPKQHQWHCSGVFIVNLKHFSHFVLVLLFLTVNI